MRKAVIVLAACALAACSQDEGSTLAQTAERLAEIRSGELSLEVTITAADGSGTTGFTLDGAFSLPDEEGSLPIADLTYVQIAGEEEGGGRFIATGESVYTELEGQVYELPQDQVDAFRVSGDENAPGVFEGLDLDAWISEPTTAESEGITTISGGLDVVTAMNDIFEIARRFGGAAPGLLEGDEAGRVREAVRSATITVESGSEDGLLRRLAAAIDFGVRNDDLIEALGPFAGVSFDLEMTIADPNGEVEVEEPADAIPLEDLVPTP